MAHKRKPTGHQKQIRFLAIFFGVLMLLIVVGMMLLLNRPVGGYRWL
jgi:predicted nucleic acid-binding Zn ribbon protein